MTRKLLAASVAALLAFAGPSYAQMSNDAVTGGQGTVTNVATACGISGGPITSTGTIQSTANPTTETGANYAFQASDMCTTVYLNNASNQIPTIAQANTTGFENGKFIEICNIGAGTQTLTPTTSTIGGASTYVLAAGSAAAPKCVGVIANSGNYTLDLTGVGGSTSFANPSATAGPSANNGSATTAMRSDASPAVQLGSNSAPGLVEGDGTSVSVNGSGIASRSALTGDCVASAGSAGVTCPNFLPQFPAVFQGTAFYFTYPYLTGGGTSVLTQFRLYMMPVVLPAGYTFSTIAFTNVIGQAGGQGFVGLYSACLSTAFTNCGTAAYGQPSTLLAPLSNTTPVTMTASAALVTQAVTYTTTYSGLYYLAMISTATSTMPSIDMVSATVGMLGASFSAASAPGTPYCVVRSFGSFPSQLPTNEAGQTYTTAFTASGCPALGIR